jgi:hypothetical protein
VFATPNEHLALDREVPPDEDAEAPATREEVVDLDLVGEDGVASDGADLDGALTDAGGDGRLCRRDDRRAEREQ